MSGARAYRAARKAAQATLALACTVGSIGCGSRSSQATTAPGQIDLTSSGGPSWPTSEASGAQSPQLTDADVEQIATRVPKSQVPSVSAIHPSLGASDAKVVLQVYSDFECPFCVRAAPALRAVEQRYRGKVRLVWRNYPLPSHAQALPAARVALAAFELGGSPKFWQTHDWLFSAQADLSDAGLARLAQQLNLPPAPLQRAASDPRYDARIAHDIQTGNAAGVQGTPATFINDYFVMGARDPTEYAIVVERALREAG